MDLANMRQNDVRSLLIMCHGCRHEVVFNVVSSWFDTAKGPWIRLAEEEM
jgi:hypothetical protein